MKFQRSGIVGDMTNEKKEGDARKSDTETERHTDIKQKTTQTPTSAVILRTLLVAHSGKSILTRFWTDHGTSQATSIGS